jgi:hypothetical protein
MNETVERGTWAERGRAVILEEAAALTALAGRLGEDFDNAVDAMFT